MRNPYPRYNTYPRGLQCNKPRILQAILDQLVSPRVPASSSSMSKGKSSSSVTASATVPDVTSGVSTVTRTTSSKVKLKPLLHCLGEVKYQYIRCLHLWYMPLSEDDLVSLVSYTTLAYIAKTVNMHSSIYRRCLWQAPLALRLEYWT